MSTDLIDVTDWPVSWQQLRELETSLRCPICFEFMTAALMLPKCSHNYCSLCIRRYIRFKTQCPICSVAVSEPELVNNRVLDDIIAQFVSVRQKLLLVLNNTNVTPSAKCLKNKSQSSSKDAGTGNSESKDVSVVQQVGSKKREKEALHPVTGKLLDSGTCAETRNASDALIFETNEDSTNDLTIVEEQSDLPVNTAVKQSAKQNWKRESPFFAWINGKSMNACSGTVTPKKHDEKSLLASNSLSPIAEKVVSNEKWANNSGTPKSMTSSINEKVCDKNTGSSQLSAFMSDVSDFTLDKDKVSCPVCGVPVRERFINIHLDRCLQQKSAPPVSSPSVRRRKPLPKLVYGLMNDKQLRQKLKDHGIPSQGDRRTLIKRHQEFVLLYNAECDLLEPRTSSALVNEVLKAEQARKANTLSANEKINNTIGRAGVTKAEIEKTNQSYLKRHGSHFSALISEMKLRTAKPSTSGIPRISATAGCSSSSYTADHCSSDNNVLLLNSESDARTNKAAQEAKIRDKNGIQSRKRLHSKKDDKFFSLSDSDSSSTDELEESILNELNSFGEYGRDIKNIPVVMKEYNMRKLPCKITCEDSGSDTDVEVEQTESVSKIRGKTLSGSSIEDIFSCSPAWKDKSANNRKSENNVASSPKFDSIDQNKDNCGLKSLSPTFDILSILFEPDGEVENVQSKKTESNQVEKRTQEKEVNRISDTDSQSLLKDCVESPTNVSNPCEDIAIVHEQDDASKISDVVHEIVADCVDNKVIPVYDKEDESCSPTFEKSSEVVVVTEVTDVGEKSADRQFDDQEKHSSSISSRKRNHSSGCSRNQFHVNHDDTCPFADTDSIEVNAEKPAFVEENATFANYVSPLKLRRSKRFKTNTFQKGTRNGIYLKPAR